MQGEEVKGGVWVEDNRMGAGKKGFQDIREGTAEDGV